MPHHRSHRRMATALAVSTVCLGLLLVLVPIDYCGVDCLRQSPSDRTESLDVLLKQREPDAIARTELRDEPEAVRVARDKRSDVPQAVAAEPIVAPASAHHAAPAASAPSLNRDWYAIAESSVRQDMDQRLDDEAVREKMWRRTGSVMFADTGAFDFDEPDTIIASMKFRRPVGVLGIGVTIGGCFFGIPLAGIPVEERREGPNVIYCTDIYE